jgi:hypothetical protein
MVGLDLSPKPPRAVVWGLPSDDRAAADLVSWAQLLASRRIDDTETLVPLTLDELTALADASRRRGELDPATTRPRAIDWNRYEADECGMVHQYYGEAWHLSRLVEAQPADLGLLQRRAEARAMQADWQAAATDYRAVVDAGAKNPEALIADARLRLALGDAEGYRKACAGLVERFGESKDPPFLNRVARVLSLAPLDDATKAAAVRLAESAVKGETRDYDRAGYSQTLAATLVRAGRSKEAAGTLKKYEYRSLWCKLFAALDTARHGQTAAAHTLCDDISKKLDAYSRAHVLGYYVTFADDLPWSDFLDLTILMSECEKLIEAAGPKAGAKP